MSELLYSDEVLVRIFVLQRNQYEICGQSKNKPPYIVPVSQSRPPYYTGIQSNNGLASPRVADEVENQGSFQIYRAIVGDAGCIHNVSVCWL